MPRSKLTFTFFKNIHLKKKKTETKLSKPKNMKGRWDIYVERPQNWEEQRRDTGFKYSRVKISKYLYLEYKESKDKIPLVYSWDVTSVTVAFPQLGFMSLQGLII